ncbi:MAG: hypothetical protein ACKO4A_04540 [Gammaproteobacteria bacterium]
MRRVLCLPLLFALAGCARVEEPVETAARFVARMSCSCVFVSGRDLPACLADLPPEAQWLDVELGQNAVRASVLWVQGVADFEEGRGCRLQD